MKTEFQMYCIFILMVVLLTIYARWQFVKNKRNKKLFEDLENRLNNSGFTKRITVYDFLSNGEYLWTVGIWLNYQKRLVALRPDRNTWNEIEIPFDKIQDVQIIEDGYSKTTGRAIGYGMIAVGSAETKKKLTSLQINIITGDNINGAQSHALKLYVHDPRFDFLTSNLKSDDEFAALMECAQRIIAEIKYIIHNAG